MKNFFNAFLLVGVTVIMAGSADAMNPSGLPTSLPKTMKAMNVDMKAITSQAANPAKNADSAALADDFVALATNAKTFVPDTVSELPAAQQPDRLVLYNKLLDQAIVMGQNLGNAFRAGDNAKAADLLKQLASQKKTGHDEFKGKD